MEKIAFMVALGLLTVSNNARAQIVTGASSGAVQDGSDHAPGNVYRVTGRVVDDVTGESLSGAKVTLAVVRRFTDAAPGVAACHATGIDGQFAFDGVPEKQMIEVRASKAGYLDVMRPRIGATPPGLANLTSDRDFVLRLAPSASISGNARTHTYRAISPLFPSGDPVADQRSPIVGGHEHLHQIFLLSDWLITSSARSRSANPR